MNVELSRLSLVFLIKWVIAHW